METMSRSRKSARSPQPAHNPDRSTAHTPPNPKTADHTPPMDEPATDADGAHQPPTLDAATSGHPTPAQDAAQGTTGHPLTTAQGQRHGPVWSASEAARRCGIGRATMTRRLQAGEIAGATRNDEGHWQVPLTGLLAAGLRPDRPTLLEDDEQDADDTGQSDDIAAAVELAELRGQLALERARREAAEQLADERAARIDDLRHVLRALEAPTDPAHEEEPQANQPAQADQDPARSTPAQPEGVAGRLRRWWRGR